MSAKLDTDYQLDEARRMRAALKQRLTDWEAAHPLQMFLAKTAGGEEGKPAAWQTLRHAFENQERRVQELKGTLTRHRAYLVIFDQEVLVLKEQETEQKGRLSQALGNIQELSPSLRDTLMSVTQEDERTWMRDEPSSVLSSEPQAVEISPQQLRLTTRARLVPRP